MSNQPGLSAQQVGDFIDLLVGRVQKLQALVLVGLFVVGLGYWSLQVVRAPEYQRLSENNRLRPTLLRAPRGRIEDRRGRVLVENVPSYGLLFDPSLSESSEQSLRFVAEVLESDVDSLATVVASNQGVVSAVVAEGLNLRQVARIEANALRYPEFRIEIEHRRLYRHREQTAHLLGYLGEASQADMARVPGLELGTMVGRSGIEARNDDWLRGHDGEEVLVVDSRGRVVDRQLRRAATPGRLLRLTLDLELQQVAAQELSGKVGAVVALDPRDGAVRALVSSPGFDPNVFSGRLQSQDWRALLDAPNDGLQNRALQNTYPPGSVFKIVLATAAVNESLPASDHRAYCSGSKRYFDRRHRCWKRGGHGWVDLHDALKYSCDIFFYDLGQEVGVDRIARYARLFGLGTQTGIDLEGERAGLVPSSEWSRKRRGTPWYPGETISYSIGQGPILVTPIQVARMLAVVANGGFRVTPYLVGPPRERVAVEIQPGVLERVGAGLVAVVNDEGSGARARVDGYVIAGKTGTAQVIEQKSWVDSANLPYQQRDHAWFASYAPAEAPELVVVVLVEHGGLGSRTAAPIAKRIYERYFRTRDLDR